MRIVLILISLSVFLIASCERDDYLSLPNSAQGLRPTYVSLQEFNEGLLPKPSKINPVFSFNNNYENYRFHIEQDSGLYISKQGEDTNLYFIRIPLADKVFIENKDSIYVVTEYGLIYFDLESLPNLTFTEIKHPEGYEFWNSKRLRQNADIAPSSARLFKNRVYIECPLEENGFVINWEKDTLDNPECFKYF